MGSHTFHPGNTKPEAKKPFDLELCSKRLGKFGGQTLCPPVPYLFLPRLDRSLIAPKSRVVRILAAEAVGVFHYAQTEKTTSWALSSSALIAAAGPLLGRAQKGA